MAQEEPEKNNKEAERARENPLLKKKKSMNAAKSMLLTCGVSVWERGQDGQKARTEV